MNILSLQNVNKPYQTKQEWVYSRLKEAIQSCALAPGTRLTLDDLAEQLMVSRVPVREALLQLQVEGLVEMTPHAGAMVSPISLDSIYELFIILEEMEVLAGRVVAERASPEDLVGLEEILRNMAAAIAEGNVERWSALNTEFHKETSRLSGMPFLQQITEKALEKWDRMRRCFLTEVLNERTQPAHEEHCQIYTALKEGDVEAVEQSLRTHNRNALKAYLAYLSERDQSRAQDSAYAN
jgi:DNA-binding GntR family transcriptional regulator